MNVLLFGATGMIGSGTLLECLAHPDVRKITSVGRRRSGVSHRRLEEVLHYDFQDFRGVRERFRDTDACFFCLGVSAAGMTEPEYARITFGFPLAAAEALAEVAPEARFCYLSAAGADESEEGRVMWARVRGRTENALDRVPLGGVWMFRPGYVQPMKGVRSRTSLYNALYAVTTPFYPILERVVPNRITTTERIGLAMIRVGRTGEGPRRLANGDINALAADERAELARRASSRD